MSVQTCDEVSVEQGVQEGQDRYGVGSLEGREVFVPGSESSGSWGRLTLWSSETAEELAGGVPLPLVGEFVVLATEAGVVRGHWVGLVRESHFPHVRDGRVRARVLSGGEVTEYAVAAETLAASEVVIEARKARDLLGQAVAAVAATHRQLDEQRIGGEMFLAQLAMTAHEEADSREWCSDFDDFMERVGLPRRSRFYDCQVRVSTTVTVAVEADDADHAQRLVDRESVLALVDLATLDWEVEDVEEG